MLRALHQPVGARAGKGSVNSGAVEFDALEGAKADAWASRDKHGLLNTLGKELQELRLRTEIKTSGEQLSARNAIPAFGLDANLQGWLLV